MMEEFGEGDEMRRIQMREQEREKRRIRDRQRRQSMTQEQRERHLARRRRNYQLRRQRAANAGFIPLPQTHQNQAYQYQLLESSAGEASTSDELQGNITSSTPLHYTPFSHLAIIPSHQGQETLDLGIKAGEVSSVQLEALAYKPANSTKGLRLTQVKRLTRSLTRSSIGEPVGTNQVAAELITKQDAPAGDYGSTPKSLRLNCVKRLARSKNCLPKENACQRNHNLTQEGIHLFGNESSIASS